MAKASLKALVGGTLSTPPPPASEADKLRPAAGYRTAQTRNDTRQIGGHFKPEVSQTLRLIAVEQDKDVQEMLAEALNMLFSRYGKPVRAEVTSGRRSRATRDE
jgi:hypothetical protein